MNFIHYEAGKLWIFPPPYLKWSQSLTLTHSHLIFFGVGHRAWKIMRIQCWHLSYNFPHLTISTLQILFQSPKMNFHRRAFPRKSLIQRCHKSVDTPPKVALFTSAQFFHLNILAFSNFRSFSTWKFLHFQIFPVFPLEFLHFQIFAASPPTTGQSWVGLWGDILTARKRYSR